MTDQQNTTNELSDEPAVDDHTIEAMPGRASGADAPQAGYWSPGARLVARSKTAPTVRRNTARSSGLLLAAAILLLAALIAVGLWMVAVWARADDDVGETVNSGLFTSNVSVDWPIN